MKKKTVSKSKVISAVAVFAISAATVFGAIPFAACSEKSADNANKENYNGSGKSISTAVGVIKSKGTGTTYYVGPNVQRGKGSGTKEDPYNIADLLHSDMEEEGKKSILRAGDTVKVLPGVYKEGLNTSIHLRSNGTYDNYISVICDDVEAETVLDFSAMNFSGNNRGVQLECNYVYWYGVDIRGAGDNGMYIAGNYNTVEYCEFYNNRDTGLQLGRADSGYLTIDQWPNYNLVKNCTSHNNYDNEETYGENADGFAAKLTVGYGNVFDGCIAYRNADDGWDLYAKSESGNIGAVIMYNCVAFENGYLEYTQKEFNKLFPTWSPDRSQNFDSYKTRDGDGNGFKLGGGAMEGDVLIKNCLSFNNRMHGVTDNSNPGFIKLDGVTSYDNSAAIDDSQFLADGETLNPYFGQIVGVENHDTHGNINVARQAFSYNSFKNVLSIKSELAKSLDADEYRGSVTDSIFTTASEGGISNKSYQITGSYDADSNAGLNGNLINSVAPADIFDTLPVVKSGGSYQYNLTGLKDLGEYNGTELTLNENRVHNKYRNEDQSINMKGILAKKAGVGADDAHYNGIGSYLDKTSWEQYPHFYADDIVNGEATSVYEAMALRALEALTLNCDENAVYQDFDVPVKMYGCTVEWESSNNDYLSIGTDKDVSLSGSEYIMLTVYRDETQDRNVTLTAKVTCGTGENIVTKQKDYSLTIKAGLPTLGEMFVTTQGGEKLVNGQSIVIDLYEVFREPVLSVENGIDYNGKLLDKSQYRVESTYKYSQTKGGHSVEVKGFTPSNAGVFEITHKAILARDNTKFKEMTYTVFVASVGANVDFNTSGVTVNKDGYIISGTTTSATGVLYALSSPTQLTDITAENIKTYAGVKGYQFRGDSISFQFENANSSEYYIYYALSNLNGDVTSQVYEKQVSVQEISNTADFMTMAGGTALDGENLSTTIYLLTTDLNFEGVSYKVGTSAFKGLLNGNGHTVSNLNVTDTSGKDNIGIFYKVSGGTVMNVKFDNIDIDGRARKDGNLLNDGKTIRNKVGIVAECNGGFFYNIAVTNVNVNTDGQRVGGLIGVIAGGTPVYIEQVSVVCDSEHVIHGQQRTGGLIGFSQASSGGTGSIKIHISNCYVNAQVTADFELGGIFGTYDCGNNANFKYNLEMENCVFAGTVTATGSKSFAAGILGYQKGAYSNMSIKDCASIGVINFSGADVLTAQKNCSGIVGGYTTGVEAGIKATVTNCLATMEEHNTDFSVSVVLKANLAFTGEAMFKDIMKFDMTKWQFVYDSGSSGNLKEPYIYLQFAN